MPPSLYHQSKRMLPHWFRFVALFMMTFVLFDVCTPEPCDAQALATPCAIQIQVQHERSSGDTCQFEEDCFGCAHYAPGTTFAFHTAETVSVASSALYLSALSGTPVIPYHPPRA